MKRLVTALLLVALASAGVASAQTATVIFKEQIDTESELEGIVGDVTDVFTDNDANMIDLEHINQGNTLAGNPAFLVDECYFVATAGGGGFVCEGSVADTNEMLFLFPDLNESDTTHVIVTDSATQTLTNKTIDATNTVTINWTDITDANAGTDGTADLEEETHVSEHQENAADELLGETLGTACTENQILKANATGGLDCAADATGGSPSFDSITTGTNTSATMTVSTGASIAVSGSGTVTATDLVAGSEVVSDAEVVDTLTASNYLPLAGGTMTGDITMSERSSDPSNPSEGQWICWMSDGTGSGDDGDVLCKITAAAATKVITLFDFSAVP